MNKLISFLLFSCLSFSNGFDFLPNNGTYKFYYEVFINTECIKGFVFYGNYIYSLYISGDLGIVDKKTFEVKKVLIPTTKLSSIAFTDSLYVGTDQGKIY